MKILSFVLVIVGLIGLFVFNWQLLVPLSVMLIGGYIWQREQIKDAHKTEDVEAK